MVDYADALVQIGRRQKFWYDAHEVLEVRWILTRVFRAWLFDRALVLITTMNRSTRRRRNAEVSREAPFNRLG